MELQSNRAIAKPALEAIQQATLAAKEDEIDVLGNMAELVEVAMENSNTNDSQTFTQTTMMAIAPSDPSKVKPKSITKLRKRLPFKRRTFHKYWKKGLASRKEQVAAAVAGLRPKLTQECRRKGHSPFTPQFIARLHKWIWKNKTHLSTSPKPNDCVNYKHPVTGEVERMQKMLYNGSVRELHLQMIKPVS